MTNSDLLQMAGFNAPMTGRFWAPHDRRGREESRRHARVSQPVSLPDKKGRSATQGPRNAASRPRIQNDGLASTSGRAGDAGEEIWAGGGGVGGENVAQAGSPREGVYAEIGPVPHPDERLRAEQDDGRSPGVDVHGNGLSIPSQLPL